MLSYALTIRMQEKEIDNVENLHIQSFDNLELLYSKLWGWGDRTKFVDMYRPKIQVFDELWSDIFRPEIIFPENSLFLLQGTNKN